MHILKISIGRINASYSLLDAASATVGVYDITVQGLNATCAHTIDALRSETTPAQMQIGILRVALALRTQNLSLPTIANCSAPHAALLVEESDDSKVLL